MTETFRVLVDGGRACVNIANLGRRPYIPVHSYIIEDAHDAGFFMRGEIFGNKAAGAGNSTAWAVGGHHRIRSCGTPTNTYSCFRSRHSNESPRKSGRRRSHATIFWNLTRSVWTFGPESAKRAGHPAPFPVELPRRLIELYTFSDEVVLDPFMGAGATALAATELGRRYVGYETDDGYADRAEQRHQRVEGRPRRSNMETAELHLDVVSNLYRQEFKMG